MENTGAPRWSFADAVALGALILVGVAFASWVVKLLMEDAAGHIVCGSPDMERVGRFAALGAYVPIAAVAFGVIALSLRCRRRRLAVVSIVCGVAAVPVGYLMGMYACGLPQY